MRPWFIEGFYLCSAKFTDYYKCHTYEYALKYYSWSFIKKKNYAYQICFYWHRHFPVNVMLDNRTSNAIEKQSIF